MSTGQTTQLKQRIRASLQRGDSSEALLKIVRNFCDSGGTKSEAYDTLQEIWKEKGFDEDEHLDANPARDTLERAMEAVWYDGK